MFGFPHATRPEGDQYKKNLLKSVIFQIQFHKNNEIVEGFKDKKAELKAKFPITNPIFLKTAAVKFQKDKTPIIQTAESENHGYEFKTNDNDKTLAVTNDTLSFTVNGPTYKNFYIAFSEIENDFFPILNDLGVTDFHRIAIRKINLVEPVNPEFPNKDLLSLVFNENLVNNLKSFPDTSFISSGITNVTLENNKNRLNLIYGLLAPAQQKKQILIDIDLFLINQNVDLNSLKSIWETINTEIFNIFNWALSDKMKEQINTGDSHA